MNSPAGHAHPESRMTVLIVRDRPSSGGGIYNYYEAIGKYLGTSTHYTEVGRPYSFYGHGGKAKSGSTIGRLCSDWFALFTKILRVRPDIVHINPSLDETFRSLRRDAANILIGRFLRRPVLVFWRGWDAPLSGRPEFPGGNNGRLCRIYKKADAHIVLSERFKEDLLRWGFKDPIHVETTVVADVCLTDASREYAAARTRTNLLYLSRVEVAKGVSELLEAYQILKNRNPAYTLTIAGDGPHLEALKSRAAAMALSDVVFTGYVAGAAKVECYRQGGVFCFLSYTEGMPNAMLEALAMGLPVVSSDAGGLRDILQDGENGFIVPFIKDGAPEKKFNPLEVANSIQRLAEDRELYDRIADFNWHYARRRFAAPVVAKRLEAIYRTVLAPGTAQAKNCPEPSSPVCAK
jgi:glycosyltransferase involved in cell wall biosynthesis